MTWQQISGVAIMWLFFTASMGASIGLVNYMFPGSDIITISGPSTYLAQFKVSDSDVSGIQGSISNPEEQIGDSVPSDVLGFLGPLLEIVSPLLDLIFLIALGWTALVTFAAQSSGLTGTGLSTTIGFLTVAGGLLQTIGLIELIRAGTEPLPFVG